VDPKKVVLDPSSVRNPTLNIFYSSITMIFKVYSWLLKIYLHFKEDLFLVSIIVTIITVAVPVLIIPMIIVKVYIQFWIRNLEVWTWTHQKVLNPCGSGSTTMVDDRSCLNLPYLSRRIEEFY
jgi:hypothetical protein